MLTCVIAAHEKRVVMSVDVPNVFVQTKMPSREDGEDKVTMKIAGPLVDMMVDLDTETYSNFAVFEGKRKMIYVVVLRAIYGQLVSSVLWYKKFRKDLESTNLQFNPYDPCVARVIEHQLSSAHNTLSTTLLKIKQQQNQPPPPQ